MISPSRISFLYDTPGGDAKTVKSLAFREVQSVEDIPSLVALARDAHAESRLAKIPFSSEKVAKIAKRAIDNPDRFGLFLATKGARPVGFLYCTIGEYHIGSKALLATIQNINVKRVERSGLAGGKIALGLLRGAESWAAARGAVEVSLHVTSGVQLSGTHRLAKRIGFAFTGGNYAKEL